MKKLVIYFLLSIFCLGMLISCSTKNEKENLVNSEEGRMINFIIDSVLMWSQHRGIYRVADQFSSCLKNEDFIRLLRFDTIFNSRDIVVMKENYQKLVKISIRQFLNESTLAKLTNVSPPKGEIMFSIDPPLFTKDKSYCLTYSSVFFWHKEKIRWNEYYILLKINKNGKYKLKCLIEKQDI
jgi:hypothetical protein